MTVKGLKKIMKASEKFYKFQPVPLEYLIIISRYYSLFVHFYHRRQMFQQQNDFQRNPNDVRFNYSTSWGRVGSTRSASSRLRCRLPGKTTYPTARAPLIRDCIPSSEGHSTGAFRLLDSYRSRRVF